MSTLADLKAKKAALEKEMQDASKLFFSEQSNRLFDQHPKLESFRWQQYTPYFNDGEECTFGAHIDYPEAVYDGKHYDDLCYGLDDNDPNKPELESLNTALTGFLKEIDEEDYKLMFGDHVSVTVTRSGVEVEHYEHD